MNHKPGWTACIGIWKKGLINGLVKLRSCCIANWGIINQMREILLSRYQGTISVWACGYVGQFKISTILKKDKGLKGLGTICTWRSMARAELCSTAGSCRDHCRKLWFWSLSNFHNVFHFGSWGLCVIWVLQCPGLLRRDPPVWEQQEETQPSPPAPESARQGSELSLHCIMRPKLYISWAELKTAAARPDTHLQAGEEVFAHSRVLVLGSTAEGDAAAWKAPA